MFIKSSRDCITILLIYVDDVVLAGDNSQEISNITNQLQKHFRIKNFGNLTYFLGLEVARSQDGIHLSQRKYVLYFLQEADMLHCAPIPTLRTHLSYENAYYTSLLGESEASSFRHLIGRLLYLTNTRPNIVFVIHHLIQFVSSPINDHPHAARKILRYLKNSLGHSIFLNNKHHC